MPASMCRDKVKGKSHNKAVSINSEVDKKPQTSHEIRKNRGLRALRKQSINTR